MFTDPNVTEPAGQTAGASMKGPIERSSDRAAWAIASKWMSRFVFISRRGHFAEILSLRAANKPRRPLQSALLIQRASGETRDEAAIVFPRLSLLLFSLIGSGKCCLITPAWMSCRVRLNITMRL